MTKQKLLNLLEQYKGKILSGPELAQQLNVSRNSVWKAINALREDNHDIISVKNKGYYLKADSDGLSKSDILRHLGPLGDQYHLIILDETPSTNTFLKDQEDLPNNTLVLAQVQTNGRGRRGRSFFSLDQGGIYMSLLKTKDFDKYNLDLATMASALALSHVADEVLKMETKVKWVNDLFISDKKVAGILTEGTMELESGTLSRLIIGMGINVNTKTFPEDLMPIATSFFMETNQSYQRNEIIAKIILELENYLLMTKENPSELLKQYKAKMLYLGEEVHVYRGSEHFTGILTDLNDKGHLLIRRGDELLTLSSGEISIKKREDIS